MCSSLEIYSICLLLYVARKYFIILSIRILKINYLSCFKQIIANIWIKRRNFFISGHFNMIKYKILPIICVNVIFFLIDSVHNYLKGLFLYSFFQQFWNSTNKPLIETSVTKRIKLHFKFHMNHFLNVWKTYFQCSLWTFL